MTVSGAGNDGQRRRRLWIPAYAGMTAGGAEGRENDEERRAGGE